MARGRNDYRGPFVMMMSYLDGVTYERDTEFTNDRLMQLTPADILRWMNFKTYGKEDPTEEDNPIGARSSTIKYWKKAISFFMPHRLPQWSPVRNEGNPTKSQEINDLVKAVKRKEVRRQGVPPQARRPIEESEFRQQQLILREHPDYSGSPISKWGVPALANFQAHVIGRIDCASQFKHVFFEPHNIFPDLAGRCRLAWSKNVNEEGDAPWQIMFGSKDPLFCTMIGLGIWLEFYLSTFQTISPYIFDFSRDFRVPDGGKKTKAMVQSMLRSVYEGEHFAPVKEGPLGSHSIRKYAATRCRRSGASKDEKDHRGRWKRRGRVSDDYDDPELPFPDAKVAAMLCPGGPCSYRIKLDSPVTDEWIQQHVTPAICARPEYGQGLARLLGRALLWVCLSDKRHWVPEAIVARVQAAYDHLVGVENGANNTNPIEKRLLVVTGDDATVLVNEVLPHQQQQQQQNGNNAPDQGNAEIAAGGLLAVANGGLLGGGLEAQTSRQLIQTLINQVNTLQASIATMEEAREGDRVVLMAQFRNVQNNIRRISIMPARRMRAPQQHQPNGGGNANVNANVNANGNANGNGGNANGNGGGNLNGNGGLLGGGGPGSPPRQQALADLSPTPRTLYILWEEYTTGIGGRKAARLFTREERGRCKHKYCRRKVVWDRISTLVNAGLTSQVACDRLYEVYGQTSTVTTIINRLKADTRNNTLHDILRV